MVNNGFKICSVRRGGFTEEGARGTNKQTKEVAGRSTNKKKERKKQAKKESKQELKKERKKERKKEI